MKRAIEAAGQLLRASRLVNMAIDSNYFGEARAAALAADNSSEVLGICISTSDEFFDFRNRLSIVVEKLWCKIEKSYHNVSSERKF